MSDRRFLVLHLPRLATDRIRQKEPELAGTPIATWDTQGNRRLLTGVDAPGTTLHVGQALADAQAMHPALVLRPADPAADGAFLERLALWAMRFTPLAAVDPPDGLVLDVTGSTGLFGGEASLLAQVSSSLHAAGSVSWPCWRASRTPPQRWRAPDSTAGSFCLARRLPRLPRCRLARCGCRMFVSPVSTGSAYTASVTSCGSPVRR